MMRGGVDRLTAEIRSATLDLLGHLAFLQMRRIATELRYREDQPRAPRGIPEGGQWIRDLGHVTTDRVHVAAVRSRAPRCQGTSCQSGGSFGTSGWIHIKGKRYCWDCAIKELGIQALPADEQLSTLKGFDKTIGE